jgi:hypothetical protein
MSSVLSQIKQVPVTGGKFVCINGGSSSRLFDLDTSTDRKPASGSANTVATGDEFIDLGVTYVDETSKDVYRKVISVVSAQSNAPAPKFIKTFTTGTVYFARTA